MKLLSKVIALATHLPLVFALLGPPRAHAQAARPAPHLGFVYPAGGQQGTTVTVSIGGQNLAGDCVAFLSGPGVHARAVAYERPLTQRELNDLRERAQVLQDKRTAARNDPTKPPFTAKDEKEAADIRQQIATRGNRQASPVIAETVTLEVTVTPDAAPGERELRLKTPGGLSNPVVFCVGQLPEVAEPVVTATSNRTPRNRAADPRTGRPVSEREITLPAVVNGQILPGEVDRIRFTARKGQRLTIAASARTLLPYLADAVPGWFQATLALYDSKGRELAYGDDYRFNPDPVLLREIPEDGVYVIEIKDAIYRGREDFVYRIAVGELPFVTSIFPLGGPLASRVNLALSGWNLATNEITMDTTDKRPGTFLLSVRNQALLSNPVRFALDTRPESLAAESAGSQRITLPAVLNGRIARAGTEAVFAFEGRAGDAVVADVLARRLGSPLDSVLTLTDPQGKTLATNDDTEDKAAGLLTHHADSRISVRLPADGTYNLRLGDAQRQGGPEFGYRLRIGAPRPDFELRIVPSSINVRAGGSTVVTVYALRRDGFEGEIDLGLLEAPRGFALSGARIPAGEEKVQLTLTAPPTARPEPYDLSLAGRATIDGKPVVHPAVPAEDMMQAFAYRHLVTARELKVSVTSRGTPFRLASALPVQLAPGGTARLRVSAPSARTLGRITLELSEPPEGITVQKCTMSGDNIDVVLACDAAKVKGGLRGNLIFTAHGDRAAKAGKAAKNQSPRTPLGLVPAVPFEVIAPRGPAE